MNSVNQSTQHVSQETVTLLTDPNTSKRKIRLIVLARFSKFVLLLLTFSVCFLPLSFCFFFFFSFFLFFIFICDLFEFWLYDPDFLSHTLSQPEGVKTRFVFPAILTQPSEDYRCCIYIKLNSANRHHFSHRC